VQEGRAEALTVALERAGEVGDRVTQVPHLLVEVLGVLDDVALAAVAEDDGLAAAQAAQVALDEDEGDQRRRRRGQGGQRHERGDVAQDRHGVAAT
jgi:hypothetical protein